MNQRLDCFRNRSCWMPQVSRKYSQRNRYFLLAHFHHLFYSFPSFLHLLIDFPPLGSLSGRRWSIGVDWGIDFNTTTAKNARRDGYKLRSMQIHHLITISEFLWSFTLIDRLFSRLDNRSSFFSIWPSWFPMNCTHSFKYYRGKKESS